MHPEAKFDFLVPEDIGRMLCSWLGPQLISQDAVLRLFGGSLGKKVKVEGFPTEEEAVIFVAENHNLPEASARQLVGHFRAIKEGQEEGA